jgi:hypothetical protein
MPLTDLVIVISEKAIFDRTDLSYFVHIRIEPERVLYEDTRQGSDRGY